MKPRFMNMIDKSRRMAQLYRNWPTALLDRSRLISRRPVLYRLRNGIRFYLDAGSFDVQIINEIWIDNIYTPRPRFSIRDGWTVVDIGGQKGVFSIFAATNAQRVQVYTFEPAPDSFETLRRNIALNSISNIATFNAAVTSKDGQAVLHLGADSGCNSLIQRTDVPLGGNVEVEAWSLERVLKAIPPPIHLMKMDIEGMEYDALLSCPAACLQGVERIALEYHDGLIQTSHSISELVGSLGSRGFSTHLRPERRILLAERSSSI